MTTETFFTKFDKLADAPNAPEYMRKLVLDLMVTGRLVPQDDHEQPASELMKKARAERSQLTAGGRIKVRQSLPVSPAERPFEIPVNWEWARLSDVGYELGQKIPDKQFTYIDVGSIDSARGRISERAARLQPNEAPSRARKIVTRGTVIYSTVRPYLRNIALVDQDFDPEPIASTAFGIVYPFDGIYNRYVFHWLRAAPFTSYVQESMKGMAYPAINDEKFYAGVIAVPPSGEQKRIVAKVDELMVLCDRLEEQQQERDRAHAVLAGAALARFANEPSTSTLNLLFHDSYTIAPADLRNAILTLAVRGKLVAQEEIDEPADVSLARLGLKSTLPRSDGDETRGSRLPRSWSRVRFEDVSNVAGGVTLGRKPDGRPTVRLPYLRVANVKRGEIDLSVIRTVSIPEDEVDRYALRHDDLLMTEGGDWDKVGRAAIWEAPIPVCLHQNHIFRARMRSAEISPHWFERYFNSPIGRAYFESASKQTTNLASINMRQVRGCPVPFPPIAEQRRIVAKLDQLMTLLDRLEEQLAASRATATNLLDAVIATLAAAARPEHIGRQRHQD
jgi:type I restriction enzyme S subunit